jgi:hypothetical protein
MPHSAACNRGQHAVLEALAPREFAASVAGIYFTASNSTSKMSVAFGGMTPPAPLAP